MYRIEIEDREYNMWVIHDHDNSNKVLEITIPNIHKYKFFTNDVFDLSETGEPIHIYSNIRSGVKIAGVLDLSRTYGRMKKNGKLLYKCIPNDKHLPFFLLPYEIKLGFMKNSQYRFVVFQFSSWTAEQTHPIGTLVENLGTTDNLEAFYEYQLYCKSLHISISAFTDQTKKCFSNKTVEDYMKEIRATDHTDKYVFSIDPEGCTDIDDAICIEKDEPNNIVIVRIYIANVCVWLDALGLWKSFSKRVSTIYLPDRKRPMLPSILSDDLCSLLAGQPRYAFTLSLFYDATTKQQLKSEIETTLVKIRKNYVYDSHELLHQEPAYNHLFDFTYSLSSIKDSHDLVAYWMIEMNRVCGQKLFQSKQGVFRSIKCIVGENINVPHSETRRVIELWGQTSGQYVVYSEDIQEYRHDLLNIDGYAQITSPIRRLVDLLNQIYLTPFEKVSSDAREFLVNWTSPIQMDYLNRSMRSIRKIQTDCELLHRCVKDPEILTNIYDGTVFDKLVKNSGMKTYMVYLPDLKMLGRIHCVEDLENYTNYKFRVFLFEDSDRLRKKIRLQMV